jgi:Carboxypeptidase regulatory-like domain
MDMKIATSRSRRKGWVLGAVFGATIALAACSSTKTTPSTTVGGVVTDSTGAVLSGVKVTAGTAGTTTAANGTFSLDVTPNSKLVVGFSKTGYLASSKPLAPASGTNSRVNVALMAVAAAQPLDATQGGSVTGDRGAALTAAPGAFVDANGQPVSGSVEVALTPLDPSAPGERAAYPGSLVGLNNGTSSLLQTYGVLDVTATQNGQPLQLAPGQTVTVTIPVAAPATGTLPPTQDLWAFNLATGTWDHEGTAQLVGSAYTAQISHFSYHNIDGAVVSGMATCVTGLVVDTSGKPVPGASVSPTQGASVDTLITTDSSGRYCTWILAGGSETITGDATQAPYGEGSISVTGGAAIAFPGSYTCSNLNCQQAPNLVLDRPACATDGDCPADDTCCMVSGHGMCLESFACARAQTGSIGGGAGTFPDGSVSGGCSPSTGMLTVAYQGQTFALRCFIAQVASAPPMEELVLVGVSTEVSLEIAVISSDNFAGIVAGSTISVGSDGGADQVEVVVTGSLLDAGSSLAGSVQSGSLTVNSFSTTSGGTVGLTIPSGTTFLTYAVGDGGNLITTTGTIDGTITVTLP